MAVCIHGRGAGLPPRKRGNDGGWAGACPRVSGGMTGCGAEMGVENAFMLTDAAGGCMFYTKKRALYETWGARCPITE